MEEIQKRRMLWRIPFVTMVVVALFWGVWWLIAGDVPSVTSLKIMSGTSLTLPFAISRGWDILFAPAWALAIVAITLRLKKLSICLI